MTSLEEKEIQQAVRDELLGIIKDAQDRLGMKVDPTGIGRKALEGLAEVIRRRDDSDEGI